MKILVPLNLNGNKLTNVSLDTNDNNSVSTVEYVNLKTKISNTLKYDYREFFDVVIDFTNATTSCKNVETLPRKNDLSCFKSFLVTGL